MSRRGSVLQGIEFKGMDFDDHYKAMQLTQNERQLESNRQERKEKQKADDRNDSADFISKLTPGLIGDGAYDQFAKKEMLKIQDELRAKMDGGMTTADLKMYAYPKLNKLSQGYAILKANDDKIKAGITDLSKDYPSVDMSSAISTARRNMFKDVLDYDEKGNLLGVKDPSIASLSANKDYVTELLSDDNLPKWYPQTTQNLEANIIKMGKPFNIGGETVVRDASGRLISAKYTGQSNVFREPHTDDEGNVIGNRLKYESIPYGQNEDGTVKMIDVMPEQQFQLAISEPKAKAEFNMAFNKHLSEDLGINPKSLSPVAKDIYQRNFMLNHLDKTKIDGASFFVTKNKDLMPLPYRGRGGSGSGSGEQNINDVYQGIIEVTKDPSNSILYNGKLAGYRMNALNSDAQAIVLDYANKANKFGVPLDINNTFIALDPSNRVQIYKTTPTDEGQQMPIKSAAMLVGTLPRVATNIKVQPGAPEKRQVIEKGEPTKKGTTQNQATQKAKKGKYD